MTVTSWTQTAGAAGRTVTYEGTLGGDSTIDFEVKFKRDRPVKGTFDADNVELLCDDSTRPVVNLIPLEVKFRRNGRFFGSRYLTEPRGWGQSYREVKGRMADDRRRVLGTMLYISDPGDPPQSGENLPECGTHRRSGWRAERR